MALLDVVVPQLGEGLQEVVVLSLMKKPGDFVKRDELLFSMETDKAVMEVKSPYEGTLREWLASEGAILPIGAPIGRIDSTSGAESTAQPSATNMPPAAMAQAELDAAEARLPPGTTYAAEARLPQGTTEAAETTDTSAPTQIPPRTRAMCKELGIPDDEMRRIPAPTGKLMPADVEAYVATRHKMNGHAVKTPTSGEGAVGYEERPLSPQQRLFVHRLKRSAQTVVPATMKMVVDWSTIATEVEQRRAKGAEPRPSEFQVFAYCVAQVVKEHPRFRSILLSDEAAREYEHVNLGIAVARPNNDLVTAVVPNADTLPFDDFVRTAQERIKAARDGEDQAAADTQLHLTYMGSYDVVDAVPVLVSPAIAVLFIGSAYEQSGRKLANLALTFDHRLINGVEAAQFLRAVVTAAESVSG